MATNQFVPQVWRVVFMEVINPCYCSFEHVHPFASQRFRAKRWTCLLNIQQASITFMNVITYSAFIYFHFLKSHIHYHSDSLQEKKKAINQCSRIFLILLTASVIFIRYDFHWHGCYINCFNLLRLQSTVRWVGWFWVPTWLLLNKVNCNLKYMCVCLSHPCLLPVGLQYKRS